MRGNPYLYETNARVFLRRISESHHRELTLAAVPDEEWKLLAHRGFDLVWLMGVWQRSPEARQAALSHQGLRREYDAALPGWTEDDVAGSPYAVHAYEVASELGQPGELARLRSRLNHHGLGLVLDFVPNHLAMDHPWARSRPELFVQGNEADVRAHPDWYFSPGGQIHLAHGRDPNFPPWSDTVQVNFFSAESRRTLIRELLRIAEEADGVRCDMAMLALNGVFERVWGGVVKTPCPGVEFWTEAIGEVRRQRPGFIFLAEVYWGLERELQQLGFDYTYDKVLYDRLRYGSAADVRSHLAVDGTYQQRSIRFIENHDEQRAISAFGRDRSLAAATIAATIPGLRLVHDGQLDGRRIQVPVQLVRWPEEESDSHVGQSYQRLFAACNSPVFRDGAWSLAEIGSGYNGNQNHHGLLAWVWRHSGRCCAVAVNYSADRAHGRLRLPLGEGAAVNCFRDELTGVTYPAGAHLSGAAEVAVDFPPWQAAILTAAK